jgi:hypothetical protein
MRNDDGVYQERAYRRGVHQALSTAYYMALRAKTVEEARSIIGAAVDEAQALRNQWDGSLLTTGGLLDAIERAAHARAIG